MAISDIITSGFGTFSSVNKIPTDGFSIGSVVASYPGAVSVTLEGPATVRAELTGLCGASSVTRQGPAMVRVEIVRT